MNLANFNVKPSTSYHKDQKDLYGNHCQKDKPVRVYQDGTLKMSDEKKEVKQPEAKFRAGAVSATVWENVIEKEGKKFTVYNTSVVKNYKDGEEWKTTNSFQKQDLPNLRLVSDKAYDFIVSRDQTKGE